MKSDQIIDRWAEALQEELVEDVAPETISTLLAEISRVASWPALGAAAAASSTMGAGAAAGAGISTGVKLALATAAAVAAIATAAATDVLPEPIQSWVSHMIEELGVDLPDVAPTLTVPVDEGSLPTPDDLPDVTIPDIPESDLSLPIPLPDQPLEDALDLVDPVTRSSLP